MEENLKDETYVPETLGEAFLFLDSYLVDKDTFKNYPEDQITGAAHMTLGRWMRNRWYLWWTPDLRNRIKDDKENYPTEKPKLVQFFNDLGIEHADDMSGIIVKAYHQKLNNKDIDGHVKEIIEYYKETNNENT